MAKMRVLPTGRVEIIRDDKERLKRKKQIKYGAGTFVVLIGLFWWWWNQPYLGTMEYGVCRTFVELQLQYPSTLNVTSVKEFDQSTRVQYTALDSYGNHVSSMVECRFRPDSVTGVAIDSAFIDRRPFEDEEALEAFNKTLPIIVQSDIDLSKPYEYGDTVESLKRD